jgi:hypothetical protein
MLTESLKMTLNEVMREKAGGTYGVNDLVQ